MMIPNLLPMDHCYSLADDANEVEPEPRRAMMMNWPAAAVVGTVAEADRSPTEEVLEPGRLCMGPNGCLLLKYQQKKRDNILITLAAMMQLHPGSINLLQRSFDVYMRDAVTRNDVQLRAMHQYYAFSGCCWK